MHCGVDASVFWDSGYGPLPRLYDIHVTGQGVFLVAKKLARTFSCFIMKHDFFFCCIKHI